VKRSKKASIVLFYIACRSAAAMRRHDAVNYCKRRRCAQSVMGQFPGTIIAKLCLTVEDEISH